jgi:hypothetical protein
MSVTSREICPEECLRREHCIGKMATIVGQRYIPAMETSEISISRATLLIAVSALGFGSISVLTVLITRAGVPLLTAMAWRYVIAAVVLLGIIGFKQL